MRCAYLSVMKSQTQSVRPARISRSLWIALILGALVVGGTWLRSRLTGENASARPGPQRALTAQLTDADDPQGQADRQSDQLQQDADPEQSEDGSEEPESPSKPGSLAGKKGPLSLSDGKDASRMLWQMLASIGVVGLLVVIAAVLLRRYGNKLKITPSRQMKLVETLHLAPRQAVHMIEVRGRRLLVSATRENVQLICDLSQGQGEKRAEFPTNQQLEAGQIQPHQGDDGEEA